MCDRRGGAGTVGVVGVRSARARRALGARSAREHCRIDATRIDQWLWAVRLYGSRTASTEACRGGHVRVNGSPAKAATIVRVGDRVTVRLEHRERELEVVKTIDKRVGAPVAAECFVDHSLPPAPADGVPVFRRDPGAGRPTKRDRRNLDRLRGH